jgi:TetR/AcrR family transcriptional repressor of bet genes
MGSPPLSSGSPERSVANREPRDARRRRQLIEATIESIAEHGLGGTTVLRVAGRAGLSAGIVNFYFDTKDALLLATLEQVDGEFARCQNEALQLAGDDPARQLEALIEVGFDREVCNPNRVAVWTAFWGEARARADYMRVCGLREAEEARRVVDLFERVASAGNYAQLDPVALGRAFYHLLSSLPEDMLDDATPFDFDEAKATCRGFLTSVFPREFSKRDEARDPIRSRTSDQPSPTSVDRRQPRRGDRESIDER